MLIFQQIGTETKWSTFSDDRFILLNEHDYIFITISMTFLPGEPISNMTISIGSHNDLAPNKRQAIIWAKDVLVYWRIHEPLLLDVLKLRHTYVQYIPPHF